MAKKETSKSKLSIESFRHEDASRKNIPTIEFDSILSDADKSPIRVAFERHNRDLDPQLVWRGKDEKAWTDLVVTAPPLHIQEKVHPKVLIDDLLRQAQSKKKSEQQQLDLFSDFNGLPSEGAKTEFYQHEAHWSNRMILGDSLQVMASLTEREGLRGKVQCIYFDPPYGIKFNSNFQWSTTSRDVKDGNVDQITREPEQVKAFRDTWRDGIHSYLTYLRDRFTVARDLLTESGSIFVQIGDENVHRVRSLLEEVFGPGNFRSEIKFKTTGGHSSSFIPSISDSILWFGKSESTKYRSLFFQRQPGEEGATQYKYGELENGERGPLTWFEQKKLTPKRIFQPYPMVSMGISKDDREVCYHGKNFLPTTGRHWSVKTDGTIRIAKTGRLFPQGENLRFAYFLDDYPVTPLTNTWSDTQTSGFGSDRLYVVQTLPRVIERCVLMTSDPGDLILDPTCGSGTTAFSSEQWGRRWITIDTSRVALALARSRIMGARFPYYLLSDSRDGQQKEAEITRTLPSNSPVTENLKRGFVYERVPHVTLKSIADNSEIDVIWQKWQNKLEPLRESLNKASKDTLKEWEIPREADVKWTESTKKIHAEWWDARIARQKEIDASIAAKAENEYLYDKPYEDKKKVRVAGPFTVESLSPHRTLGIDENDSLIDPNHEKGADYVEKRDFSAVILENLKTAGVQQAHKDNKIDFVSLVSWPGDYLCAEGHYLDSDGKEKKAGVFVGPEFGTVSRSDLITAAREAADAGFDVLIACAFSFDAHSTELDRLGKVPILKARMNADLHMAEDLKNTGKGNLFVIFGEPDIDLIPLKNDQFKVKIKGIDLFKPSEGKVVRSEPDELACWFLDTDYNEESFFIRHAYFLGAGDPYKSLKTTLKAEINEDAWASINSDTSRPFEKPKSGKIAVKVINHLGDEVMKVFKVK